MKISSKGRYALRLIVDLAEHAQAGYVSLKDVSERQEISKKYLEQIVSAFNQSEILTAERGNKGGYRLALPPEKITVGDVLRITEGNLSPVTCLEFTPGGCRRSAFCPTLPVWQGLDKVISEYLDSVTIADIVGQQQEFVNNYVI